MGTQTLLHRSVAMHGLLQQVLPAILRIVYPARDSEALAPVGDVPRGVEVPCLSLRFSALATIIFVLQPLIGLAFGGRSASSVRQEMSYSAGEALLVSNSMGVLVNL